MLNSPKTVESAADNTSAAPTWMIVVASEDNGAPGSWRWNVKRRRGARWSTVVESDQAYLDHDEAQEARAFVSAERIWDRRGP